MMIKSFGGKAPRLDASVFVAETAALIGDVTVGQRSSVWYGAVVRADMAAIVIGEGSDIQDNATLHCHPGHDMHIGSNVSIGHNAVVHCAAVGDNTLVGMGARLLDGAKIGKNCIIGAGAVVTQNAQVPDGTMMLGVPARPVKTLDAAALATLEQEKLYAGLSRAYLAEETS